MAFKYFKPIIKSPQDYENLFTKGYCLNMTKYDEVQEKFIFKESRSDVIIN